MRKIVALALPLVFLSLITVQANAVITPVEVERVKDVCFIRMRGDHHTQSFLFHYDNLSPEEQVVGFRMRMWNAEGVEIKTPLLKPITVSPSGSIDRAFGGGYGYTMEVKISIENYGLVLEDSVIIPPPP